jgi:hypothetical protein
VTKNSEAVSFGVFYLFSQLFENYGKKFVGEKINKCGLLALKGEQRR